MSRGAKSDLFLLFSSCSHVCALALTHVREIMRPLPVQSIAGAPAMVMGVAVVRGAPTPVIDAARLLTDAGAAPLERSPPTRFISLKLAERSVCLAVEAVLDVRPLTQQQLHQTPPLLDESASGRLPLLGTLDRELLIVLNAARMVPESVWSSL